MLDPRILNQEHLRAYSKKRQQVESCLSSVDLAQLCASMQPWWQNYLAWVEKKITNAPETSLGNLVNLDLEEDLSLSKFLTDEMCALIDSPNVINGFRHGIDHLPIYAYVLERVVALNTLSSPSSFSFEVAFCVLEMSPFYLTIFEEVLIEGTTESTVIHQKCVKALASTVKTDVEAYVYMEPRRLEGYKQAAAKEKSTHFSRIWHPGPDYIPHSPEMHKLSVLRNLDDSSWFEVVEELPFLELKRAAFAGIDLAGDQDACLSVLSAVPLVFDKDGKWTRSTLGLFAVELAITFWETVSRPGQVDLESEDFFSWNIRFFEALLDREDGVFLGVYYLGALVEKIRFAKQPIYVKTLEILAHVLARHKPRRITATFIKELTGGFPGDQSNKYPGFISFLIAGAVELARDEGHDFSDLMEWFYDLLKKEKDNLGFLITVNALFCAIAAQILTHCGDQHEVWIHGLNHMQDEIVALRQHGPGNLYKFYVYLGIRMVEASLLPGNPNNDTGPALFLTLAEQIKAWRLYSYRDYSPDWRWANSMLFAYWPVLFDKTCDSDRKHLKASLNFYKSDQKAYLSMREHLILNGMSEHELDDIIAESVT